ncbi:hypothetical protein Cs7R123_75690 [Catellatospora sp. TT07R-123]|uniref:hypothetical protein n=1 Tax=Catellatospora sp. TT07R-123 TaxID=2733863 RepID=UPI001B1DEF66|nr:hypothetical protein [Catellatospora sp. TT07R-123]GHJ50227.1 hypothetical protein Cs7R123_75690 [Catellatospora sp. TT07R-123]
MRLTGQLWRRHAAVGVVGALSVLTLAGYAKEAGPAPLSVPAANAVEAGLVATYERINGTVAQRAAVEVLTYSAYQQPMKDCMAKEHFSYTPPPFAPAGAARTLLPFEVSAVVEPGASQLLTSVAASVEATTAEEEYSNPGFDKLPPEKRQQYSDQLVYCEPPAESYEGKFVPEASLDLDAQFLELLRRVGEDPAIESAMLGYGPCMAKQGIPANDLGELYAAVREKFNDHGRPVSPKTFPGPWKQAIEFQDRAVAADRTCRTSVWQLAMARARAELSGFTADHEGDLNALGAKWVETGKQGEAVKAKLPL